MNITLIGMPGAGKSSVGRELASSIEYEFIDIDILINNRLHIPLQQLIDTQGDQALVNIESEIILDLNLSDNSVISTGGSVIYSEKSMQYLKEKSLIIFLDVPLYRIKKQIGDANSRGIIGLKNNSIETLFIERHHLYQKYADTIIYVIDEDTVKSVSDNILDEIEKIKHVKI